MTKTEQYLVDYIRALLIVELSKPTQAILDKEIEMIIAGETSEDDKLVIELFQAEQK